MNTPLVSIVIPTFNRAFLIAETLDSVLAQTYTNWECIVVDDGSTDATKELLNDYCEKDPRFQYHQRPNSRTKGANACRNYGFELSTGEYIQFFDSDDQIDSNILKSCVNIYKSNPKVDFIFFNYLVYEKAITNIILRQDNNSNTPFHDYFAGKINLQTGVVLWKNETILKTCFDENLKKSQELNFIFTLYKNAGSQSLNGIHLNANGFYLRKHENSIVGFFHNLKPDYLFSDIIARNQILKYFSKPEYNSIHLKHRFEIKRSLRFYFYHCDLIDFIKIVFKLNSPYKFLGIIKAKLLFYKIVFTLSKRDYRLNKVINLLYIEEFYLDYN